MDLKNIYKELKKDRTFFEGYKDTFITNFSRKFSEEHPQMSNLPLLNTLVSRLYLLLFSLEGDPLKELYDTSLTLAKNRVALKKVLVDTLLNMVKDYIDFIAQNLGPYTRVKTLIDLIDIYIRTVEDAYIQYLNSLREEVKNQKEEMITESETLARELLHKLFSRGSRKILVHALYRGLFIDTNSEMVHISGDEVLIKTSHMSVYSKGMKVHLKGSSIPQAIEGIVEEVNHESMTIRVKIGGFVHLPEEKRKYIRVVPEKTIKVHVSKGSSSLEGIIADLCIRGVGVYLKDASSLRVGDKVKVSFTLPKGEVEVIGEVKHITPHENLYRVGIYFEPSLQMEEVISDFVVARQMEILREIKD
ncbi:MAG: PilZ domain-containing protein [Aquificae bacterium]|nr:PilZ domain-containing protein [Aquificota bacterium]